MFEEYHIADVSPGLPIESCPRVTEKIMINLSSIRDRVVDTAVTVVMWSCVMGLLYITVVMRERQRKNET